MSIISKMPVDRSLLVPDACRYAGDSLDEVAVLPAHVEVTQHVVGDPPNEGGDPACVALFTRCVSPLGSIGGAGRRRMMSTLERRADGSGAARCAL